MGLIEKEGHPEVDHLHVIHLCRTCSTGFCNCSLRYGLNKQFGFTSKSWHKPRERGYIENVSSYLRTGSRRVLSAFIAGNSELDLYNATVSPNIDRSRRPSFDFHSIGTVSDVRPEFEIGEGSGQNDSGTEGRDQGIEPYRKKRSTTQVCSKEEISKILVPWILKNQPNCSGQIALNPQVHKILGKFLYHTPSKRDICDTAWNIATAEWNHKTFKEIIAHHYEKESFNNAYYYSIKYSYWLALRLLKNQLICHSEIYEMINFIKKWADNNITRKSGKKNTLMYEGQTNSGKSLWTNVLLELMWNVGYMKNANKSNQFAYDDCEWRRMLFWTECRLNASHVDQCKKILEGSPMPADVKFRSTTQIQPTPVLIDSNLKLNAFCREHTDALKNRVREYHWTTQNFLQHCERKLNPLLWYYMFNLSPDFDDLDNVPDESHFKDSLEFIVIQDKEINMFEN